MLRGGRWGEILTVWGYVWCVSVFVLWCVSVVVWYNVVWCIVMV